MNSNLVVQLINVLILLAILMIPFFFVFLLIKKIRKKYEESDALEIRIAVLERRVEALEDYIADSE